MAHFVLHKEMDAFQWDGDNYDSILKAFGPDWILGTISYAEAEGFDGSGYNRGKYYLRLKLAEDPHHTRLVPLGQWVCKRKGEEEVFEMKDWEFKKEAWVKSYDYKEY